MFLLVQAPLSYLQAIILGLLQGVTELFPISSLGHTVMLPKLLGWNNLVLEQSQKSDLFLTFVVGLHVATALALVLFFWKDWVNIIKALFVSIARRKVETTEEKLAWLLVIATIPAGLLGLLFDSALRELFAKPAASAGFLFLNGIILLVGERFRSRHQGSLVGKVESPKRLLIAESSGERSEDSLSYPEAIFVGFAQSLALLAGISRSGATMVAGLIRGLSHEAAARFAFLLATPVILLAGLYKLPSLLSSSAGPIRNQVLVGAFFAFIAAFLSVRFLSKYFQTRNLYPFAAYSLAIGSLLFIKFI